MKKLFIFIAISFSVSAYADDWIKLTETADKSAEYYGLKNSYALRTNKKGEEIVVWTEKQNDRQTSIITIGKLYVRTKDCQAKQGKAVSVNLDGDFLSDFDFIFGAGSVGAFRAEMLCDIYLTNKKDKMEKGI